MPLSCLEQNPLGCSSSSLGKGSRSQYPQAAPSNGASAPPSEGTHSQTALQLTPGQGEPLLGCTGLGEPVTVPARL